VATLPRSAWPGQLTQAGGESFRIHGPMIDDTFRRWAQMSQGSEESTLAGELPVRLTRELTAALKRKPADEPRLAGGLRVVGPASAGLRAAMVEALDVLIKRGSTERPLFAALVRTLAEAGEPEATASLISALGRDDAGGFASLGAAGCSPDPRLSDALARVVTRGQAHLAFAAELARVVRGESSGQHLAGIAPKIKESHRLDLCSEVLVPLLFLGRALPVAIAPAMAVLSSAERHLGRWLVLAEIAVRAGSAEPLEEAKRLAADGAESARAAWSLLAWALGAGTLSDPRVRPTVELISRLSDRPSAERDMTFLFRMAEASLPLVRPMLEGLGKSLGDVVEPVAIRACGWLVRDHQRADLADRLADLVRAPKTEAVRGLAAAALFDAGERSRARKLANGLVGSRTLQSAAWAHLILSAADDSLVVQERHFRRLQLGWVV
jgi:hypothetical protein